MKYFLLLVVCLATLDSLNADQTAEDAKNSELNHFTGIVTKCKEQFPAVDGERVQLLLKHLSLPQTNDEKCIANCIMTNSELLVDGRISVPGWKKLSLLRYNHPKVGGLAGDAAEFCYDKVKDEAPCELAFSSLSCIVERSNQMKIPTPDLPK